MRIFTNLDELFSEIYREVYEMGVLRTPKSMQNKVGDFKTKEILNYHYCLTHFKWDNDTIKKITGGDPMVQHWIEAEFQERVHPSGNINPGQAYKWRSNVWDKFLVGINTLQGKHFDYTYNERIVGSSNNLQMVINELYRNPDSRQAIIPIFSPDDIHYLGGKRRIPCSMYYHLFIIDNRVDIIYNQRSCDVITHYKNDLALACMLRDYIVDSINLLGCGEKEKEPETLIPGYFYHNIDSLHCYEADWDKLRTQLVNLSE